MKPDMPHFRGFFATLNATFVLLITSGFLWAQPVHAQDYCWNGTCYESLHLAETAMRNNYGSIGQYLEAYRTIPSSSSVYTHTIYYAMDVKSVVGQTPYAFWSILPSLPAVGCVNDYPTPDHYNKCNSLLEAAAVADETLLLQSYNLCYNKTTPKPVDFHEFPVGGASWEPSRDWFEVYWGLGNDSVVIRQFRNPVSYAYKLNSENCAIEHVAENVYAISVMEASYCPAGMWDTYWNRSPVSGNVRRVYPYECWNSVSSTIQVKKPLANASCGPTEGNPCEPLTGNKKVSKTDFEHHSLPVSRHYNSLGFLQSDADVGRGWTHNYSSSLRASGTDVMVSMPDGSMAVFSRSADQTTYLSQQMSNVLLYLMGSKEAELRYSNGDIWKYSGSTINERLHLSAKWFANDASRNITIGRNDVGLVTDVIDPSGRSLRFNYLDGYLASIDTPNGDQINYVYETVSFSDRKRLVGVDYQDASSIAYEYGDSRHPYHLTAIVDENNQVYATYIYDDAGRVTLSTHANGAGQVALSYNGLNTTVTTPQGDSRVYHGQTFGGGQNNLYPSFDSIADGDGNYSVQWNASLPRRKLLETDKNGNQTRYQYDAYSRLTEVRKAYATSAEVLITDVWDSTHNRIAQSNKAGKSTAFTFNSSGQVLTKTITDTATAKKKVWTNSYFEPPALGPLIGKVQTVDGPRTDTGDITTFEYYATDDINGDYLIGDVKAVVNALGHRINYSKYDANGRPLEIRDANDILTVLSYHPRGWISTRTTAGQTTSFVHDGVGNITRVTQPDGSFIDYEYDGAHRLAAMADTFNNRIEYTLDVEGNRVLEKTYDDSGSLRRQLKREFDQLNRLATLIDGNNHQAQFTYDKNGNRTSLLDANLNTTHFEYDALDRLIRTIDANLGETTMEFDARDNLVGVTDPLGNVTRYTFDGLDQQVQLDSPDTGASTFEYDTAGNRISVTDARGVRTQYVYDALNRLTEFLYPDSSLDVSFTYDAGSNGKGRLTRMTDAVGVVDYAYDARGNLISETRINSNLQYVTAYAYNNANRLTHITYPSGMVIDYTLDSTGRITAVKKTLDAVTEALVSGVQYQAFGPIRAFTYGNGLTYSATFDQDYQLDQLRSGPELDWLMAHDPVGNILTITDRVGSQNNQALTYDDLYRLETGQGGYGSESFEYDANGNRRRYRGGGLDDLYTYQPQSNRLAARKVWTFDRDAAGNRTAKLDSTGLGQLYLYADHNRLNQVSIRDAFGDTVVGDYEFDGRGQRVRKTTDGVTLHFVYGPSGELLGEYQDDGSPIKEYIYMNGQVVAISATETVTLPSTLMDFVQDNDQAGTSKTGSWAVKTSNMDYGNNYRLGYKASTYRWTPRPLAGLFDVYAWWVPGRKNSAMAQYTINHKGKGDRIVRAHNKSGGHWSLLGRFGFDGIGAEYVELRSGDGKKVSADAIRFTQISSVKGGGGGGVKVIKTNTYFVHADHLGTPRRVSNEVQTTVWRWDSRPFGNSAPSEDPDGDANNFNLNLRFPGQYYDAESGLHYNYFRTYDPGTGRYIESDPVGLGGGLNTFGYVGANPGRFRDPLGLCKVEARCNLLGAGPILGSNISHCFIVVTEPGGGPTYFRGGPSSGGGSLLNAASNSNSGFGVDGDSGFGNIVNNSGAFLPNTVDWPTDSTPPTGDKTYINNDKPCGCIVNELGKVLQDIQNANIPYNPLSTNSNSVAFRALQEIGISPGVAPAPAPGWGIPLPVSAGSGSAGQCCDQ